MRPSGFPLGFFFCTVELITLRKNFENRNRWHSFVVTAFVIAIISHGFGFSVEVKFSFMRFLLAAAVVNTFK